MAKIGIGICMIICLVSWACKSDKMRYRYKLEVNSLDSGVGDMYIIHQQFLSSFQCNEKVKHASVFLCTEAVSGDSVFILGICQNHKFDKNSAALLLRARDLRIGDSVIIEVPEDVIGRVKNNFMIGDFRIPVM